MDNYRIHRAISQFGPGKSAGPDEYKPVVLQNLPESAISFLRCLYNACLQLTYIPVQWCHSKVIFISKAGKESHLEPRSFRPICLQSFLYKTFEKLVLWQIEETAFAQAPLHPRQFAFRKNMSTGNALSESINSIEKNLLWGRFVIAIYLDIRGAFDNVRTRAIIRALKNRGVESTVLNMYEYYLENRTCEATLGGSKCLAKLNQGTPQGGPGSPILGWNNPYDDLLRAYDDTAIEQFGFADDTHLQISGLDFGTCFGLAQNALKIAEDWAQKIGVSFCPNKTAVLFFSRGQWKPTRRLSLYGKPLNWLEDTKYLGVTIDRHLNFQTHINKKIAAAKKKLMILRHVFDQTWGPHPKIT